MTIGMDNYDALRLRVEDAGTVEAKTAVPVTLTTTEMREAALHVLGCGGYGYDDSGDGAMDAHALAAIVLHLLGPKVLDDVELVDVSLMPNGTLETRVRDRTTGKTYDLPGTITKVVHLGEPLDETPGDTA